MFRSRIRKIGNSHGLLLPAEALRHWGLRAGEQVELSFDADRLIVQPARGGREDFLKALEEVLEEDAGILADLAK